MLVSECIDMAIDDIELVVKKIYISDKRWSIEFDKGIKNITRMMEMFYGILPALNNMGLEFERQIISEQLKEVNNSLKKGDCMRLADMLRYEVKESLLILKEIVDAGVVKNEELL